MASNSSIIDVATFDINSLEVSDFKETSFNKAQNVAMILYNKQKFIIQSPWMLYNVHGIKPFGEYIKNDDDRNFIRIPLDVDNFPKLKIFKNKIAEIDKLFDSNDFKTKFFTSKNVKNHKYGKLIRMCEKSDNYIAKPAKLDKNGVPYKSVDMFTVPYITGKLNYDYSNDWRKISTVLIHNIDGVKKVMAFKTVSDLVKLIPYQSKIRYVIELFKLGEMKTKDDYKNVKYNANFKILMIEVKPFVKSNTAINITCEDLIDDSDDEDIIENKSDDEDASEDSDDE